MDLRNVYRTIALDCQLGSEVDCQIDSVQARFNGLLTVANGLAANFVLSWQAKLASISVVPKWQPGKITVESARWFGITWTTARGELKTTAYSFV